MKANTYSLINTPWMIEESGKASLIPQLISLIKGNEPKEVESKLPVVYMEMHDDESYDVPEMTSNSQYICVLSIKSPLYKYDQMCGPTGTRTMMKVLKEWESNDSVIGVVIDMDCPGGQVSGLAEFAKFLNNYPKPLVAYTDELMASAGYYVAAACKGGIIANEYSNFIGSIGTMLSYVDLEGILINEGAVIKDIYATGSPRKNEESRKMKNENSDALLIKNILDPAREQFVADMNSYRPGMNQEVFDGAIYKPSKALELKLIDSIVTIQDAFNKVVELSKSTKSTSSINKSNNNMSKNLPKLEAVLGLEAPLATTDNGSYLNQDQLDQVEARLDSLESENSTLQNSLNEATTAKTTAVESVQSQLTEATNSLTAVEASVDATLAEAGLPVEGTLTEKLTALNSYATKQGAKDGADHTNVKRTNDSETEATTVIGGVDISADLNN